ncbi:MAG TPA: hypothetical protein VFE82_02775 [Ramlibacter sp.]|uniref:hypothetical protein n=1 Tax=Ramlibacter sp. TaxID=1917967 RepID=UPI002D3FD8E8|nr:hypothetical protein [Ramlibacter sp.]HZY17373.1 hypothetical protein [Ramlibacter sp.]
MTSFVHIDYSTEHPGVARFERAASTLRDIGTRFDGARGAATMLLAAIVAALVVVANQVVDTWTEGHLLAAWVVLWTITFAAIGLFASPVRRAVQALNARFVRYAAARRDAAADRQMWDLALSDARVMAELSRAMSVEGARVRYY